MAAPRLIAIGGMSGSGKTSLAAALAQKIPNAVHLDSDRTRKALFGVPETERLPPESYSDAATQRLIVAMDRQVRDTLAVGKTPIVSAAFLTPESRTAEEALARSAGVEFSGLWLAADVEVLCSRVETRTGDASDAGVVVVRAQAAEGQGAVTWPVIDAGLPRADVLAAALKFIDGES